MLAENVLLLEQVEYRDALHRVLSVLKMRFSAPDHLVREFVITAPEGDTGANCIRQRRSTGGHHPTLWR